jgi:mannose-6-phosphate isomerase-like protein (cupin superfamily)
MPNLYEDTEDFYKPDYKNAIGKNYEEDELIRTIDRRGFEIIEEERSMKKINWFNDSERSISRTGESVFPCTSGRKHSIARVFIPKGCRSQLHKHPQGVEETYYIIKGEGFLNLDGDKVNVSKGDAVLIEAGEIHMIVASEDLEFIVVCSPPWTPEIMIMLEDK